MVAVIQPSFSAGEISDRVQARVDLTKRTVGVKKALNASVSVTGSLDKRPGTEYIDTTYGNGTGRLIPFKFNRSQTYVLVFTDNRLEIYRDGVQRESIASPYDITDVWDLKYAQYGDQMTIVHPSYAPRELIRASDTSWSFDTIDFTPGQAAPYNVRVEENSRTASFSCTSVTKADPAVVTSAAAHGLSDNDLVVVSAAVAMTEIQRSFFKVDVTAATTFALQDPEDNSDYSTVGYDTWTSGNLISPAPRSRNYVVTAVNGQTGEESIAGKANWTRTVSSVSSATPAVVVVTAGSGWATGDEVTFESTGSILDGERFIISRIDSISFSISWMNGEDVDGSDVFESGGAVRPCFATAERSLDTKWDNEVYWGATSGAVIYNVYASDGGAYGLIGSTTRRRFRDYFTSPDTSIAPPLAYNPFFDPAGGTARYPSTVAYHNQRRIFGNSDDYPNRFWMTQVGNFYNMAWSTPTQDDDAIVASIASSEINDIAHMLSLSALIILTEGGEFKIDGAGSPLTPSTATATPQSYYGSAGLPPLVAGNIGMLHLTGNVIRDFEYSIASQSFVGVDLTILARHLLDDYVLEDWAYAHSPQASLVVVREDGIAPAFTYFPEQEVFGWTHWVTDGDFISVCSIPEDGYDRIYAIVKRVLDGTTTYCIERFALPSDDPYSYHGVDCGVDVTQSGTTITGAAVSGAGVITFTASSHGLSNGDIVDISGVRVVGDDSVIEVYANQYNGDGFVVSDATTHTFKIKDSDGAYVDGSGFASYSSRGVVREAVTTVGGLTHLNGETVVAAANGQEVTGLTVSGGQVTLPSPASEIHVGLPFTYEVETLPVSAYSTGGTIEGVMKNVNHFALHVIAAANFYGGPERDGMVLYERRAIPAHSRQTMMNQSHRVTARGKWDRNRSLMLQQRSPLPMSIASIIPDAQLGEM